MITSLYLAAILITSFSVTLATCPAIAPITSPAAIQIDDLTTILTASFALVLMAIPMAGLVIGLMAAFWLLLFWHQIHKNLVQEH